MNCPVRLIISAVAISTIAGCAVMTVDVDVYKGSLANHPDVQMEQTSVMAMGARPLLYQLRNALEWQGGMPEALRSDPALLDRHEYANQEARQVNAVLSLYSDKQEGKPQSIELKRQLDRSRIAMERYQKAYRTFHSQDPESMDPDREAQLRRELSSSNVSPLLTNGRVRELNSQLRERALPILRSGCLQLLCGGPEQLFANNNIFNALTNMGPTTKGFGEAGVSDVPGANAQFEKLANPGFANEIAHLVVTDTNTQLRSYFISRTVKVAAAFREARESLEELWRALLETIILANTTETNAVKNLNDFNRDSASYVMDLTQSVLLLGVFAPVAGPSGTNVNLIPGVRELWNIVTNNTPDFYSRAEEINQKNAANHTNQVHGHWDTTNPNLYAHVKAALVRAFVAQPASVAIDLMDIHQFIQVDASWSDANVFASTRLPSIYLSSLGRRYGLARGPTIDPQEAKDSPLHPGAILSRWKESVLNKFSAEGLEDGRLDIGLSRLIDNYLQAAHLRTNRTDSHYLTTRQQLLEDLSRFATKVLFIANYQQLLLTSDDSTGPYPLRTGKAAESVPPIKGKRTDQLRGYSMLLQAVGNSILAQVDELRNRKEYEDKQVGTDVPELRAWQQSFVQSPVAIRETLTERLAFERDYWARTTNSANQALYDLALAIAQTNALTHDLLVSTGPSSVDRFFDRLFNGIPSTSTNAAALTNLFSGYRESFRTVPNFAGASTERRDVIDQYIADLRYEHLRAIRRGGPSCPEAATIAATIEAAYEYRNSAIYLRPAASFLRTSYPASALQDSTDMGWHNMLADHAHRNLPGYDILARIFQSDSDRKLVAVKRDIDRQFWQRVNQVRVAGAGRSNYVLAKDDVGNWYVKNYSTDPQDIIKSAKNLALFAAGPSLGSNLLGTAGTNVLTQSGTNPPAQTNSPPLDREFDKITAQYLKESQTVFTNLLTSTLSVENSISKAWSAALTNTVIGKLTSIEQVAYKQFDSLTNQDLKAVSTLSADDLDKGVSARLWAFKRYYETIKSQIDNSGFEESVRTNAANIAAKTVRDDIKDSLRQRTASINRYSSAISILGDLEKP
jgi:hypothetical protein